MIAGIINAIISFFIWIIFPSLFIVSTGYLQATSIITEPVITLVLTFVFTGIFFVAAKLLGGKGAFSKLYYLSSLYAVPLSFFLWIPWLGLLVLVYGLHLFSLAAKEALELTHGKAVAAMLLTLGVIALIYFLAGIAAFIALGAVFGV